MNVTVELQGRFLVPSLLMSLFVSAGLDEAPTVGMNRRPSLRFPLLSAPGNFCRAWPLQNSALTPEKKKVLVHRYGTVFSMRREERRSPRSHRSSLLLPFRFLCAGCPRTGVPRGELPVPEPGRPEQFLLVARIRPFREGPVVGGELQGRPLRDPGDGRRDRRG